MFDLETRAVYFLKARIYTDLTGVVLAENTQFIGQNFPKSAQKWLFG